MISSSVLQYFCIFCIFSHLKKRQIRIFRILFNALTENPKEYRKILFRKQNFNFPIWLVSLFICHNINFTFKKKINSVRIFTETHIVRKSKRISKSLDPKVKFRFPYVINLSIYTSSTFSHLKKRQIRIFNALTENIEKILFRKFQFPYVITSIVHFHI